ncbi:unnamed protein product [Nippostrongylus brasiliensis]|uniref:Uncharacterized protein n=1 Tax=Nippostrongylus brasiliensis TaxID=27835 RepID=A0A0N4YND7_NIPBR|nr:unnamed protein product [Nippostrongylus brasiliensis]
MLFEILPIIPSGLDSWFQTNRQYRRTTLPLKDPSDSTQKPNSWRIPSDPFNVPYRAEHVFGCYERRTRCSRGSIAPIPVMNLGPGIRSAHAKIVQDQRRRFRSLTDEAGSQIRNAIRSLPSKASSTIRSHVSSVYEEQRKVDKSENNLSDVIRPALQTSPSPDVGRAEYTVNYKQSVSSLENNDSETLL